MVKREKEIMIKTSGTMKIMVTIMIKKSSTLNFKDFDIIEVTTLRR